MHTFSRRGGIAEKTNLSTHFLTQKIEKSRLLRSEIEIIYGDLSDEEMSEHKAVINNKRDD